MNRRTITGDARKLLDTFIEYATRASNEDVADAMWYDRDEMRRRAFELQRQLDALDNDNGEA